MNNFGGDRYWSPDQDQFQEHVRQLLAGKGIPDGLLEATACTYMGLLQIQMALEMTSMHAFDLHRKR